MKRRLSLLLSLILILTTCTTSAFALNYSGSQRNGVTFETLEEVRLSSPAAIQQVDGYETKVMASHPVLDGIAEGTVFVYRSANMYGSRASGRQNTNLLVCVDQHFSDKADALAYLQSLGLTDIIDEAIGSIVLITPANGRAFGQADQNTYYKLQTVICNLSSGGTVDGVRVSFAETDYIGGFGYIYAIGIDGGATFMNNYVASMYDFVTRLAGMLLINGNMEHFRQVAGLVPVYLANPADGIIEKYCAVNDVDATDETDDAVTYYNETLPLQKVIVAKGTQDNATLVKKAYYDLFIKAMRLPVVQGGLYTAGTPYQGAGGDKAPYTLCDRTAVINGRTAGGMHVIRHDEDRFSAFHSDTGEYLQTWFEYIPDDVFTKTAPAGTVPLVLGLHGAGDDPNQYADEIGLITLAEREHLAVISPEHNSLAMGAGGVEAEINGLVAMVNYMLESYPALDASRVYVTGYSMGGGSTSRIMYAVPELFAAAVPMSAVTLFGDVFLPSEEQEAHFANLDLPIMNTTSGYDLMNTYDYTNDHMLPSMESLLNESLFVNELPTVDTFDYETYAFSGFKGDRLVTRTVNNEYTNRTWYVYKDGIPMVALNITEGLTHALYPEYANLFWNFAKHYSRNLETGEIVYTPYVK